VGFLKDSVHTYLQPHCEEPALTGEEKRERDKDNSDARQREEQKTT